DQAPPGVSCDRCQSALLGPRAKTSRRPSAFDATAMSLLTRPPRVAQPDQRLAPPAVENVMLGADKEICWISGPEGVPSHQRLEGVVESPKRGRPGPAKRSSASPPFWLRSRSKRPSACSIEHS